MDRGDRLAVRRAINELGSTSAEIAASLYRDGLRGRIAGCSPLENGLRGILGITEVLVENHRLRLIWIQEPMGWGREATVNLPSAACAFHQEFMAGKWPSLESGIAGTWHRFLARRLIRRVASRVT